MVAGWPHPPISVCSPYLPGGGDPPHIQNTEPKTLKASPDGFFSPWIMRGAAGFLACALTLIAASPSASAPAPLPPAANSVAELRMQIEAHLSQPRFSGALWGVKINSLATGHTLFEQH